MKAARPINDPTMHVNFLNIGVFLYKILYWVFYKKKKGTQKKKEIICFETFKRNHFIWAQIKILFGLFLSETFHAALAHCLGEIVSPRKICPCFLRGDRLDAARFAVALAMFIRKFEVKEATTALC